MKTKLLLLTLLTLVGTSNVFAADARDVSHQSSGRGQGLGAKMKAYREALDVAGEVCAQSGLEMVNVVSRDTECNGAHGSEKACATSIVFKCESEPNNIN